MEIGKKKEEPPSVKHALAHRAWPSDILTEPETGTILSFSDRDRYQMNQYYDTDSHADICLRDYLLNPDLKNEVVAGCHCQQYLDMCQKESRYTKYPMYERFSVRHGNLRLAGVLK